MLIYNLCPKTNLSTGQNFSDLSTTSATYRPKYELEILSRALYRLGYSYYLATFGGLNARILYISHAISIGTFGEKSVGRIDPCSDNTARD